MRAHIQVNLFYELGSEYNIGSFLFSERSHQKVLPWRLLTTESSILLHKSGRFDYFEGASMVLVDNYVLGGQHETLQDSTFKGDYLHTYYVRDLTYIKP